MKNKPLPSLFSAEQLRDAGIKAAEDNANRQYPEWSEKAFNFLVSFSSRVKTFMIEDVREASKGFVPEPPNNRVWGGITVRAKKEGIIKRIGYGQVKNANAHMANAAVWTMK